MSMPALFPHATTGSGASDSFLVGPGWPACLRSLSAVACVHDNVVFAFCMQWRAMFALVPVQTCLLSHTADMSAVRHSRLVC